MIKNNIFTENHMSILCFLLIGLFLFNNSIVAQHVDNLWKNDPEVRIGQLKNGLTYYIRHNEEPKERAFFYIAQKVGSIQEEPNQRGLAHFLEHMCFNGTKHFPGQSLRTYLEKIGVKFGADLNAYTSVDETVYNIDNVPVKAAGAIDSCLWILHDWSHDLLLEEKEIDSERGVIQEEWRMRNDANQRMNEAMMPVLQAGSKYADCMPIGSMDIVMHFPYKALRDYYIKWYRPDLQGIIVVGDIDVNTIEKKIISIFSDIPKPKKNVAQRVYYPVPDNEEPIFFCGTDKEITSPTIRFFFKHDATPRNQKNTREYQLQGIFNNFIYGMFHDHTRDIAMKPNSPFAMAFIRDGGYFLSETKRAVEGVVGCRKGKGEIEKGAEAFLRELFRVRQHGFTQSEFDRYRKEVLSSLDRMLRDKEKRNSRTFVNEYVRHFLDNDPIPNIDDEVSFWKQTLPTLTVDDMNKYFNSLFYADKRNMCIAITAGEDQISYLPTKEQILTIYDRISQEKLEAYVDQVSNLPFLPVEPTPGKIVSETTDGDDLLHMTLSNGMKVILKKTDFRKDQILVQAMAHGGQSLYPAEMYKYGSLINMMISQQGWGNYNLSDMEKNFTGVHASIQAGVADNYQSVSGSCSPEDIKILMEKIHAAFLYPKKDVDAFKSLIERIKRNVVENEKKPSVVYSDSLQHVHYGDNPYAVRLKKEDYERADYDQLLNLYKERFSDASNFTVTFVGNIEVDMLRPYIEKYLASLPSTYKKETAKPVLKLLPGSRTCKFVKEQETPSATITIKYHVPGEFTLRNQIIGDIAGQILTIIYTKIIREEAGAAYSVGAGCSVEDYPENLHSITVRFPTSPATCDLAVSLVDKGIDDLIKNGPNQADIDKAKEYIIKTHRSNIHVNEYWQYALSYEWNHGINMTRGYEDIVNSVTAGDIQEMVRNIRNGYRLAVVMTTEK